MFCGNASLPSAFPASEPEKCLCRSMERAQDIHEILRYFVKIGNDEAGIVCYNKE